MNPTICLIFATLIIEGRCTLAEADAAAHSIANDPLPTSIEGAYKAITGSLAAAATGKPYTAGTPTLTA